MAMPQTRDELNQIIETQVREAIGPPQLQNIAKLTEFFPMYDKLAASFTGVKNELDVIKSQLEGALPSSSAPRRRASATSRRGQAPRMRD